MTEKSKITLPGYARLIHKRSRGFTLLEVLVALGLFSLASAATVPAFTMHIKFNNRWEVRSGAIAAAQSVLDQVRIAEPASLPLIGDAAPVDVWSGNRTYQVALSYCEEADLCATQARFITARVSYRDEQVYEVDTVFTQLR